MRYREIAGGIRVYVSLEEDTLVQKILEAGQASKHSFTEREQEVARKLVSRGVLNRVKANNEIAYVVNSLQDLWRD
jgi:DNA-binding NarL/FixJ family response regulator